jgi:hypothetical protein
MNHIYRPGTIVCARYKTFSGKMQPGVFLVLYDEALDSHHQYKENILVLKCTTSDSIIGNYTVSLNDGNNPFLERDTIVACSKAHTLCKNQVFKELGVIAPVTYRSVYKVFKKFMSEIEREMEDYL